MGFDIKGIRFPGWGETVLTEKFTHKYFSYIATHMVGEKPIIGFNGVYKTPYNLLLHELKDYGHDVYIIHGHVGNIKQTQNNFNLQLYLQLVDFLTELESKYKIKYMTHGEYVEWLKQKKI